MYARWGALIPASDLKEGKNVLSFLVLNQQKNGYLRTNLIKVLEYCTSRNNDLLTGMKEAKVSTNFSIGLLNKMSVNKATGVVMINDRTLRLNGWATDIAAKKNASGVLVEIDGRLYKARYGSARPDVARHLGSEVYRNSGWNFELPVSVVGLGQHNLGIRIISNDSTSYYRVSQQVHFNLL